MKCDEIRGQFSAYLDEELDAQARAEVEKHLDGCASCHAEWESYCALHHAFASLELEELPADFSANFRARLAKERKPIPPKKKLYQRAWIRVVAACACLLLVIGLVDWSWPSLNADTLNNATASEGMPTYELYTQDDSIASDSSAYSAGSNDFAISANDGEKVREESSNLQAKEQDMERKIIRNWNLSLQVADFEVAFDALSQIATTYGGYVVSGESYDSYSNAYRSGYIRLRVDAGQANAAVDEIKELGKVENQSFYSDDVTTEYYDAQARLVQYEAQESRLLALYVQANTVEEIIAIESELTSVRYEIDALTGQLKYYDQLTQLSEISITLYTPASDTQSVTLSGWSAFASDVRAGFLRNVNAVLNFFLAIVVWVLSHAPVILLFVLLVLVIFFWYKKRKKKKNKQ